MNRLYDNSDLDFPAEESDVDSETSELIETCLCKGLVFSRDCVMCDGAQC